MSQHFCCQLLFFNTLFFHFIVKWTRSLTLVLTLKPPQSVREGVQADIKKAV